MFRRLFLPFLALIVAVIGGMALLGAELLKTSRLEDMRGELRRETGLVRALVGGDVRAGRLDEVARKLRSVGAGGERRVTIVAADGRVLADTDADPATMDNHRLRPEIVEAAAAGEGVSVRQSGTVHAELMYFAMRDGDAFVRVAVPVSNLESRLRTLYLGLAITAALAISVAGTVCFWVVRRHTAPLARLTQMADAIAGGDLAQRSALEEAGELGILTRSLNAMAESLSRMVTQAAKDREELRTILATTAEGVIATDRDQRILLVNAGAATLLGFDAAAAKGKPLWEVVREESVLKAASEALSTRERRTFQLGPRRDRVLEISVAPWPPGATPEGLVVVAQDRTEQVRYQEMRKEFVANVSHELRTPLSIVQGFVETLHDGALHDPVKGPEYLGIMDKHVKRLARLVNDLLELSRLESRAALPRRLRVDVGDLLRRVEELMRPAAEKRKQTLAIEGERDLVVAGDPDFLERAFSNLVDNAIKYTPDGGEIRVRACREESAVVVTVADSGIGIPKEDLPRIFERFYRVDKSRSREMGGSGLGLSIVKHVVQAHGGTVEVESEPGKGATFRLTIPASTSMTDSAA